MSEGVNLVIKVSLGFETGTNEEGHFYLEGLNNKKRPLQITAAKSFIILCL